MTWVCATCTFVNDDVMPCCEICGDLRGVDGTEIACPDGTEIACPGCTYTNDSSRSDCWACGARLDGKSLCEGLPANLQPCPYVDCRQIIEIVAVNCGIFRCGVGPEGQQMGQHIDEVRAATLIGEGYVGCGRQSQFVNGQLVACTGL